jgi:hypothetical protein
METGHPIVEELCGGDPFVGASVLGVDGVQRITRFVREFVRLDDALWVDMASQAEPSEVNNSISQMAKTDNMADWIICFYHDCMRDGFRNDLVPCRRS